jgi:hypothetical protein
MLLPSPESRKSKAPDLPLDTPEQIERWLEVEDALERRARRRIVEGEADGVEIGNDRSRLGLTRERIYLVVGLFLLAVLLACGVALWIHGETSGALDLLGATGGLGGAGAMLRRLPS